MATVIQTGTITPTPPSTQKLNREEAHLHNNIRVSIETSSVDNSAVSGNSIIGTVEDAADDGAAGTVSV